MVIILMADGFEEIEAITVIDLLRRAQIDTTVVSCCEKQLVGGRGITIEADKVISEVTHGEMLRMKMLVIPGGMGSVSSIIDNDAAMKLVDDAYNNDCYLAAICAGPLVLSSAGLLEGKNVVCYPDTRDLLVGSQIIDGTNVCADGKIITSKGVGTAIDFSLKLIEILKGDVAKNTVAESILHVSK